jgi:hypothetical protein
VPPHSFVQTTTLEGRAAKAQRNRSSKRVLRLSSVTVRSALHCMADDDRDPPTTVARSHVTVPTLTTLLGAGGATLRNSEPRGRFVVARYMNSTDGEWNENLKPGRKFDRAIQQSQNPVTSLPVRVQGDLFTLTS